MCTVSVYELKTQLSKYISMLESGKEDKIQITKNGVLVATIIPQKKKKSIIGIGVGKIDCNDYKLDGPEYDDIPVLFGY
ncbi:MAG: hypothetical protein E7175_02285 [Erysipelotrichaceae bacterium]|nr:hypothetical protein [Erysipelotrichaceae bacterium]